MDDKLILKNIKRFSYITCIYIAVLIFVLIYFDILYNIGKYNAYPIMLILACAEILKFTTSDLHDDKKVVTKQRQSIKLRKGLRSIFIVILTTVMNYILAVLFGAQLFHVFERTLMFSIILTTLTTIPGCIHLGIDKIVYMLSNIAPFEGDLMSEFIFQNICMVYIGTWFGAFVIPLDWDRPWQIWPIPCSLGAMIGYFVSHFLVICGIPKNFRLNRRKTGKYDL